MVKVAVVGTGIAGLGCARALAPHAHLTLFEKDSRFGGHAHTVTVEDPSGRPIPIDTGFMVFNTRTYPRLCQLFAELGVASRPTSMSFSVTHAPAHLSYSGGSLRALFPTWRQALRPSFARLLLDIARFGREARAALPDLSPDTTVADFIASGPYGHRFRDHYLLPLTSAIWSTPPAAMLDFPARTLFRFLDNHGLLGLREHLPWRTLVGGSRSYRDRLLQNLPHSNAPGRAATRLHRHPNGVTVVDDSGVAERFDFAVVAAHAPDALRLLDSPTPDEARLLGAIRYHDNHVLLHTDARVMPPSPRVWSSWNYRFDGGPDGQPLPSTHYWMNSLQDLPTPQNYFVSVNGAHLVRPEAVRWQGTYAHPVFDVAAIRAQQELPSLNRTGPIFFCGAYFGYGFHEDGLRSGQEAAAALQTRLDHELVLV